MAKVGRPKKIINYEQVEKLASIFCTQEEIAAILDVSISTLQHNQEFLQVHKKGLQTAKMSLRRKQFKLADTNAGMAIFLGKNYLNQRDYNQVELGASPDIINRLSEIATALSKSDTDSEEAVS